MIQLGRFDELGSGVINIHKYLPAYSDGAQPLFEDFREGFRLTLPLSLLTKKNKDAPQVTGEVTPQVAGEVTGEVTGEVAGKVTGEVCKLLNILEKEPLGRVAMQSVLKLQSQANFRDRYLVPALETGLIERTIPDKPNSRLQKYRLTNKGKALLAQLKKEEEKP